MSPDARGFPGDDDYEEGDNYSEIDGLLGPSIPAVSFLEIGAMVEGVITDITTQDQRDPDGKVRTWQDGTPRRQVILTLQTDQSEGEDDDGRRRLFVKGASMPRAFRQAITDAKVQGPRPGGRVFVEYVADGEPAQKGLNPPKQFQVTYTPPVS